MPKAPAVIHVKKVYSPDQDRMVKALRILLDSPVSIPSEKDRKESKGITARKDG